MFDHLFVCGNYEDNKHALFYAYSLKKNNLDLPLLMVTNCLIHNPPFESSAYAPAPVYFFFYLRGGVQFFLFGGFGEKKS